jgi:hypothetical protein
MKKLLILTVCAASLAFTSSAKIGIAPVAGLNLANLAGEGADGNMKIGVHVGVLKDFSISDKFSIQPGLLFSTKGTKMKFDLGPLGEQEFNYTLTYLEIPINAVYRFGGEDGGFMLHGGPYLGYLLGAKLDETSGTDGMKKMDFGINVGAGYQLPMGLFFRAQYGLGLASIYEDGESVTNRVIGISVGYNL